MRSRLHVTTPTRPLHSWCATGSFSVCNGVFPSVQRPSASVCKGFLKGASHTKKGVLHAFQANPGLRGTLHTQPPSGPSVPPAAGDQPRHAGKRKEKNTVCPSGGRANAKGSFGWTASRARE